MRLAAIFSPVSFRQMFAAIPEPAAGSAVLDPGFGGWTGPVTLPAPLPAPGPAVSGVTTLPAVITLPAGDWKTNMPILPGGPIEGRVRAPPAGEPGSVPGAPGEVHILPMPAEPGEVRILPMPTEPGEVRTLPMPTEPGEVHILPFPLPGAAVSLIPWGSWIGL